MIYLIFSILGILLSGCSRAEEKLSHIPRNENQIARSWIHSKNPQIVRELDELKLVPQSRSFLLHLNESGKVSDTALETHLRSHFKIVLMNKSATAADFSSYGECQSIYDRLVVASKLQIGEMRSTIYNFKSDGLDGVHFLNVAVRAPVPHSDNYILFESSHLVIPDNIDKTRLFTEKGDMIQKVLENKREPPQEDILRRYSVIGYTAGIMQNISSHVLASYNKRMKIGATRANECFVNARGQSGEPAKFIGVKTDFAIQGG